VLPASAGAREDAAQRFSCPIATKTANPSFSIPRVPAARAATPYVNLHFLVQTLCIESTENNPDNLRGKMSFLNKGKDFPRFLIKETVCPLKEITLKIS
jgi:hypothetical protein